MIEEIREKILGGQFEFSKHAVDQSIVRGVMVSDVREAIADGKIIEDYPDDKYGPSCLIFGRTRAGGVLHTMQLSVAPSGEDHYALRAGREPLG